MALTQTHALLIKDETIKNIDVATDAAISTTYYVYFEATTDEGKGSFLLWANHYNVSNGAKI